MKKQKVLIRKKLSEIGQEKKVFVFIDELDRCKPSYSIALLERLKHFFHIENFVYIFAVDLIQLSASAKSLYGDIDTASYFRKFF